MNSWILQLIFKHSQKKKFNIRFQISIFDFKMGNGVSCSTSENIYMLNEMCTNGSNPSNLECYKDHGPMTDAIRISTGVWHIFIAFIGIFGNMTTLIAIPYAAKKKRHGIHNDYSTTTVFLLYLSFVELLHCVLMAIPRGIMYLVRMSIFIL